MLNNKINELRGISIRRKIRLAEVIIFCVLAMFLIYSNTWAQEETYLTDEMILPELGITDEESQPEELDDSQALPGEAEADNDEDSTAEAVEPEEELLTEAVEPEEEPLAEAVDAELPEEAEEEVEEVRQADGIFAYGISVDVGSWTEFVAALQDEDVGEIVFTADIERTSSETGNNATYNPGTITRSLRIDGGGYSLIQSNGATGSSARNASTLFLGDPPSAAVLEIENLTYEKTYGPAVAVITQSGTTVTGWTTRFMNVNSTEANIAALINAPNAADVEISGGMNISKTGTSSGQDMIAAKQITASGTVSMEEKGSDAGGIMSATGDIVVQNGATFRATELGAGDVMNAGGDVEIGQGVTMDVSAAGAGTAFTASLFEVGRGTKITAAYASPSSNPSVFMVDQMVIEEEAAVYTDVTGAIYGIRSNYLELKPKSVFDHTMSGAANAAVYMETNGIFRMDEAKLNIAGQGTSTGDSGTGSSGVYGSIKEITIDNGSAVDIEVNTFGIKTDISSELEILNGSKVDIVSVSGMGIGMYENTGTTSGNNTNRFVLNGVGSELNIRSSNSGTDQTGSSMYIQGANSLIEMSDSATMYIRADNGTNNDNSALQIQGQDSVLQIKDKAVVKLSAATSSRYSSPVLRFRRVGGMTLEIDDAELYVESDGGSASGIRMYGEGNEVYVKNGGYLYVYNPGNGTANNGGTASTTAYNMGIQYEGTASVSDTNGFYLTGQNENEEGSTVEVYAGSGPGIYAGNGGPMDIHAGKGTIFEVYGCTSSGVNGIFNSRGALSIIIDEPEFFDFKNGNMARPAINASDSASTFSAANTTFSLWTTGSDWNQDPTMNLRRLTHMNLSGAHYATIVDIDSRVEADFRATYENTNITAYNRMSSNNARPIVDELRIGTDADQYIYGHASISEGRGDVVRDAWTDEVYVLVEVLDENNNVVYGPLKTQTVGLSEAEDTGINPFGMEEAARGGMFEIAVPGDKYLQEGHTVRVIGAWRGDDADSIDEAAQNDQNVLSRDTDLKADPYVVQHVIPPSSLTVNSVDASVLVEDEGKLVLTTRSKTISGTYSEAGVTLYVYHNGQLISDGTDVVGTDNKWEVTLDDSVVLEEGDVISVALNDKNPPGTIEDSDRTFLEKWTIKNQGNESPEQNIQFHNVEIAKRLDLEVVYFGTLELKAPASLDFQTQTIVPVEKEYKVSGISAEELGVLDTRKVKNEWELYLTVNNEMTLTTDTNLKLQDALIYKYKGTEIQLTPNNAQLVYEGENALNEDFHDIYSETWYEAGGDGLYLKVKPGVAREGSYKGQITWTLYDTP